MADTSLSEVKKINVQQDQCCYSCEGDMGRTTERWDRVYIKGVQPEWCISTIIIVEKNQPVQKPLIQALLSSVMPS